MLPIIPIPMNFWKYHQTMLNITQTKITYQLESLQQLSHICICQSLSSSTMADLYSPFAPQGSEHSSWLWRQSDWGTSRRKIVTAQRNSSPWRRKETEGWFAEYCQYILARLQLHSKVSILGLYHYNTKCMWPKMVHNFSLVTIL